MSDFSRLLSGFSRPFGCPYSWVFLPLVPPRFTFWLSAGLLPWLFSFRCCLPPPLPPAIAGSCSLSLPSPLPAVLQFLCAVRSFCFSVVSPCLHDLLLLGFLLFNSLGYLGASLPEFPSVSLRFCVLPGVHVFLIHGFRLPLRFSLGLFPSRLRCYALRFLFCIFFFLSFSIRKFRRLPSLATVASVPVRYSFFLCVGLGRLACLFLTLPLLSLVYLPLSLFTSGSSLPFIL